MAKYTFIALLAAMAFALIMMGSLLELNLIGVCGQTADGVITVLVGFASILAGHLLANHLNNH